MATSGEVPGHELDDRSHAHHGRADPDADEVALGDGGIYDPLFAEALSMPCETL